MLPHLSTARLNGSSSAILCRAGCPSEYFVFLSVDRVFSRFGTCPARRRHCAVLIFSLARTVEQGENSVAHSRIFGIAVSSRPRFTYPSALVRVSRLVVRPGFLWLPISAFRSTPGARRLVELVNVQIVSRGERSWGDGLSGASRNLCYSLMKAPSVAGVRSQQ